MSDSAEKSFKYHEFELTMQGYALRQRAIAGGIDKPVVSFTRGALGEGRPENEYDVAFLEDLVQHKINIPVKESKSEKANHMIALVVDSIELGMKEDFLASEIGIFAQLENGETGEVIMPEILYGYTYTDGFDYIPDDSINIYRELKFNTIISKASTVVIEYDRSQVYVTHQDFTDGVKDISEKIDNALTNLEKSADDYKEAADKVEKYIEENKEAMANIPQIYVSAEEPLDWKPYDWWYQEVNPNEIKHLLETSETIKDDDLLAEIDGKTEAAQVDEFEIIIE